MRVLNYINIDIAFIAGILLLVASGCNHAPAKIKSDQSPGEMKSTPPIEKSEVLSASVSVSKDNVSRIQDRLKGKWQREDGGYVLEIFSVSADGKLDAGYFNPNPIHVGAGEWKIIENRLFLRVVLKDVNYPGSTYTLECSSDNSTLGGNYYQAVEGMNFDVVFNRMK